MITCNGKGANGSHCCVINNEVCQFLNPETIRCTVWHVFDRSNPDDVTRLAWKRAPVGQFFARLYPGYNCKDWPQNIPAAMAGSDLCCWGDD